MLPFEISSQIAYLAMTLGFIASFLTPFRLAWRVVALGVILTLAIDQFRPQSIENDPRSVFVLLSLYLIVAGIGAAIRVVALFPASFRPRAPDEEPADPVESEKARLLDGALMVMGGLYVGGHAVVLMAASLSGQSMGYLAHAIAAVAAIGALVWTIRPALRNGTFRHWRLRTFAMTASGLFALASVTGAAYPFFVSASMQAAAEGRPHCLYLADRQRTAQSLQDLTLFTMDKSEVQMAVMMYVRDGEATFLFPWTYYGWGFERNDHPIGPGTPRCTPEAGFSRGLPLF